MKKMIFYALLVLMMLVCSSCQKKQERISMPVEVWNGQNFHLAEDGLPVSIIWYRGWSSVSYKGFCQAKEIKEIVERLQSPEMPGPIPELPLVLGTRNRLCLFYYKGEKYVSRVAVFDFDIDEDGVFIGPRGKSLVLGKLLQKKEESEMGNYAYGLPNEFITQEMIDRNKAVQQQMQEYLEQQQKNLESRPFELVEMTLDAFSKVRLSCQGILIRRSADPDPNHALVLLGELHKARWIVGRDIQVDRVLRYPGPMITVFAEFRKAECVNNLPVEGSEEYQVIFLDGNNRNGYRINMGLDKRYVYGPGYRSRQLRKEFAKMGLFETK
ncbi:MAG: hypothetical protein FJ263_07220 [Planctomycetes bacterium]|nr:hypothetical protein [Planctomycetota bacterium]